MASPKELRYTINEVARILEGDSTLEPEEITGKNHDEAKMYVHPGFADYSGFLEKTLGLGRNEYSEYLENLSRSMQESAGTGSPTALLYPEDFKEETEEFIKNIADTDINDYIPTYSNIDSITGISADARPVRGHDEEGTFSGEARFAGVIEALEDGGRLEIYGELSRQCYMDAVLIAKKVGEEIEKDFTVEKKSKFPEKRFLPLPVRNISLSPF